MQNDVKKAEFDNLKGAAIIDHYPAEDEIEFFKELFKVDMVKIDIISATPKLQKYAVSPFYKAMSLKGYEPLN